MGSQVGPAIFHKSKVVTVLPRYIIANQSADDLDFAQVGTLTAVRLPPGGARHPWHWPDNSVSALTSVLNDIAISFFLQSTETLKIRYYCCEAVKAFIIQIIWLFLLLLVFSIKELTQKTKITEQIYSTHNSLPTPGGSVIHLRKTSFIVLLYLPCHIGHGRLKLCLIRLLSPSTYCRLVSAHSSKSPTTPRSCCTCFGIMAQ